jgi:hypothetical protein
VPFGWRVGDDGALIEVPEQQRALKRMRRLRDQSLPLRTIAEQMGALGITNSHMGVGVRKALRATGAPSRLHIETPGPTTSSD